MGVYPTRFRGLAAKICEKSREEKTFGMSSFFTYENFHERDTFLEYAFGYTDAITSTRCRLRQVCDLPPFH